MRSSGAIAIALWLACACEDSPHGAGLRCELGDERVLDHIAAGTFGGVDLEPVEGGAVVAWSTQAGAFVLRVDVDGAPRAEPTRLGDSCDGGVAVAAGQRGDEIVVACLRRPYGPANKPGHVMLATLDAELGLTRRQKIGRAGTDSWGVDVLVGDDGPVIAWRDAGMDGARVWRTELRGGVDPGAVVASSPTVSAGPPRLMRDGAHVLAVWAETWSEGAAASGQVVLQVDRAAPRQIAEVVFQEPTPTVARDPTGLVVAFRDERRPHRRAGLYAVRLDDRYATVGEPVRVGRANGRGGPHAFGCMQSLVTAVPRSWSNDELVALNVLDGDLVHRVRERHMYEFGHSFTRTAAACVGPGPLVAVAEEGHSAAPEARLRVVPLRCE